MAKIKHEDAAQIITSLRRSIECGQYCTEQQLVWLVELVVITAFYKNPKIVPNFKNPITVYDVKTSMVQVDARYSFLWDKLVKFRNAFCHNGFMVANTVCNILKEKELLIIDFARNYNINVNLNNYLM